MNNSRANGADKKLISKQLGYMSYGEAAGLISCFIASSQVEFNEESRAI
jgi:hypothetical protein